MLESNKFESEVVIGHRGLSSILPQNTIEALISASFVSDFVEFDLQFTKDNQIVIFHDRGLKRMTDIAQKSKYSDRLKTLQIDDYHKSQENWWIRDFSYAQLQGLKIRQSNSKRPSPKSQHHFKIPLFTQFLQQWIKNFDRYGKDYKIGGLLIQIKQEIADQVSQRDQTMMSMLNSILFKYGLNDNKLSSYPPIILQSFCLPMLKYIKTSNPTLLLYDSHIKITKQLVQAGMTSTTIAIGITQQNLAQGKQQKRIQKLCDELGLKIFYWTLVNDADQIPFKAENFQSVYNQLRNLGVIGFISDFPHKCQQQIQNKTPNIQQILAKLGYDNL